MLDSKLSSMTAQKMRIILIATMVLIIILTVAGFVFIRSQLESFASQVQISTTAKEASALNINTLKNLKTTLAQDADTIERTRRIVANSQSYEYQDQIIADINSFASQSHIVVAGYSFNVPAVSAPKATGAAASNGASLSVDGLKSTSVTVNLSSPVAYKDVMNFIHLIEGNLTKMQLTGISFNKDVATNDISSGALTIEVYTR